MSSTSRTWTALKPQLVYLLRLKSLNKQAAATAMSLTSGSIEHVAGLTAGPRTPESEAALSAALRLFAKVAAHVLQLVAQQQQGTPAFEMGIRAATSWVSMLVATWQKDMCAESSLPALVVDAFTTGLLEGMAAFSKLLLKLLPQSAVAPETYICCSQMAEVYMIGLMWWPDTDLPSHPLLAPAAEPIYAAWLAMLRHDPDPAARAAAAAAADAAASTGSVWAAEHSTSGAPKYRVIQLVRALANLWDKGTCREEMTRPRPDKPERAAAVSSTVLGSSVMLELLLAELAFDVGVCWQLQLPEGQSALKAPRKMPLKGFGAEFSSSGGGARQQRRRQLQSIYVEPAHEALLEHLGVVLPPLDRLLTEGKIEALSKMPVTQLVGAVSCVEAVLRHTPRSQRNELVSTPTLCKLQRLLMQYQLCLDAQQNHIAAFAPLCTLNLCTIELQRRCSNSKAASIEFQQQTGFVPGPASDSEASDTALALLRLHMHHVVPAMLYGFVQSPQDVSGEPNPARLQLLHTTLGSHVRICVKVAIGAQHTVGSWLDLADTDRSAIIDMIEQQPLQSLVSLEMALREDFDRFVRSLPAANQLDTGGSGSAGAAAARLDDQLSLALALFGVPECDEGGDDDNSSRPRVGYREDDRDFSELGLLSPALMAAAGRDDPPGLRQRVLSLMATGLKLAVVYAEAAPLLDEDNGAGVVATGLVTSICHCFNAFSSSCNSVLEDPSIPPDVAVELRQELLAMTGRLLHAAGRVQQLLYEREFRRPDGPDPSVIFKPCLHTCADAHWLAACSLWDLWSVVKPLPESSACLLHILQQQEPALLPESSLQALLAQESELAESYRRPCLRVKTFTRLKIDFDRVSRSLDDMWELGWQETMHGMLEVSEDLQTYGAALAALCPRTYLCNNLECLVLDHETESAAATKLCSQCRQARYCCAACQKANWRDLHKPTCSRLVQAEATSAAGAPASG